MEFKHGFGNDHWENQNHLFALSTHAFTMFSEALISWLPKVQLEKQVNWYFPSWCISGVLRCGLSICWRSVFLNWLPKARRCMWPYGAGFPYQWRHWPYLYKPIWQSGRNSKEILQCLQLDVSRAEKVIICLTWEQAAVLLMLCSLQRVDTGEHLKTSPVTL